MLVIVDIKKELEKLSNKAFAESSRKFFKTGKGQYGEGDRFIGVRMPAQHRVARKYYQKATLVEVSQLLKSEIHEYRMTGLLILVLKFNHNTEEGSRKEIFDFYLEHVNRVNNWDLVDVTCHKIVGEFLMDKDRSVLYKMAKSANLWERRIAIISTMAFIKKNQFADTLAISEILLGDSEDLIHKATGWMLREVGVRDRLSEEDFLKRCAEKMPRTMLRYAIERFEETTRKKYLKIKKNK